MSIMFSQELRWDSYVLISTNEFDGFWKNYLLKGGRNILYILGKGFDPRMCQGIEHIISFIINNSCSYWLIEFEEGEDSPSKKYTDLVEGNLNSLRRIINDDYLIQRKRISMWTGETSERRRTGTIHSAKLISLYDISQYTDIILDISALPQSIYFSIIGKLLSLINANSLKINFHVIVCENSAMDRKIKSVGLDEQAEYIHGFSNQSLQRESDSKTPKIWIPVLGEENNIKLEKIYELVKPDEICPVLPFPAINPRRRDDILIGYIKLLFDRWQIEFRNIMYASEQNPYQVYRKICQAVLHYDLALEPLGGCKFAVSAASSKLLSLGALLAVYELNGMNKNIGLAHVEAQGYDMGDLHNTPMAHNSELFSLWLTGDCYN